MLERRDGTAPIGQCRIRSVTMIGYAWARNCKLHSRLGDWLSPRYLWLLSAAFLIACEKPPPASRAPQDSWYRAVDNPGHEFYPLPPFLYSPVKLDLVEEAVTAMGDGPLLQLSTSEAIRYADDRLRTVRELRPFLIHGLYRTTRNFTISIADRALWVDSLDDPDDNNLVRRQPIVLYMDEVPPDVYVTLGAIATQELEKIEKADGGDSP